MSAVLTIADLAAGYGRVAVLDGLDLRLEAGEVCALIGANGAGKSTLLRVLAGELPVARGEVLTPTDQGDGRPPLLRLAQQPDMPPFVSLLELVALGLSAWRPEGGDPVEQAAALLDRWGLAGRRDRPVRLASPGELRRALLALVDGVRPRLLLLDEVLSALDPVVLRSAESLVAALGDEGGATLLVTHDLGLAERLGDRVLLLAEGRIAASWTRAEVAAHRAAGQTLYDLFLAATAA